VTWQKLKFEVELVDLLLQPCNSSEKENHEGAMWEDGLLSGRRRKRGPALRQSLLAYNTASMICRCIRVRQIDTLFPDVQSCHRFCLDLSALRRKDADARWNRPRNVRDMLG
jgi:hypothetical protein